MPGPKPSRCVLSSGRAAASAGSTAYYVALLSAAVYHGASHQAPQVFQVMADGRVLDRAIERVRPRFYASEHPARDGWSITTAPAGTWVRCAWLPGWTWGSPPC